MKNKYFGLELECVMNEKLLPLKQQGYHNKGFGDQIPRWSVTSDSTISTRGIFEKEMCAELVCEKTPFEEWKQVMDSLKNFVTEMAGGVEVKDVFDFNTSCGAHIHFSTDGKRENRLITMSVYNKLREAILKRVGQELPVVYRSFKTHYFRSYSKFRGDKIIDKSERYSEINYTCLDKGVEWRSFNLLGVETWKELYTMVQIAIEELNKILEYIEQDNFSEVVDMVIPPSDFKTWKEHIEIQFGGK